MGLARVREAQWKEANRSLEEELRQTQIQLAEKDRQLRTLMEVNESMTLEVRIIEDDLTRLREILQFMKDLVQLETDTEVKTEVEAEVKVEAKVEAEVETKVNTKDTKEREAQWTTRWATQTPADVALLILHKMASNESGS
uniref:Uncharacterized protein n=1 Tax=Knipowitschia caucasica TaxID=637954 RepID=A0AAV2LG12_KNICA